MLQSIVHTPILLVIPKMPFMAFIFFHFMIESKITYCIYLSCLFLVFFNIVPFLSLSLSNVGIREEYRQLFLQNIP